MVSFPKDLAQDERFIVFEVVRPSRCSSALVIITREDVHRLHTRVILSKLKSSRLPNDSSAVIIWGPEWPVGLCSEQQCRPLVQTLNDWGGSTTQVLLRRDIFTSLPPLKRCSFIKNIRGVILKKQRGKHCVASARHRGCFSHSNSICMAQVHFSANVHLKTFKI